MYAAEADASVCTALISRFNFMSALISKKSAFSDRDVADCKQKEEATLVRSREQSF
jgi:hypothetical protein